MGWRSGIRMTGLQDKRRNLTGETVFHVDLHPELLLKSRLLDLQIRPDMVDLRIDIQHVLVVLQSLTVVGR